MPVLLLLFKHPMQKSKNASDSEYEYHEIEAGNEIDDEIYCTPKKQMKYERGSNNGKWNFQEKLKYFVFFGFVVRKQCLVRGKKYEFGYRRMNMIFKMMSEYLGSRNLLQCRSHHQKMCEKYGSLGNILKSGKKQLPEQQYKQIEESTAEELQSIFELYKSKLIRKKPRTQSSKCLPKESIQSSCAHLSPFSPKKQQNSNPFSETPVNSLQSKQNIQIQIKTQSPENCPQNTALIPQFFSHPNTQFPFNWSYIQYYGFAPWKIGY